MGGELMLVGALLCGVGVPLLLLSGLYIAARSWRGSPPDGVDQARATLDARLARGEIAVEEYYERESALRSAAPVPHKRRRFP